MSNITLKNVAIAGLAALTFIFPACDDIQAPTVSPDLPGLEMDDIEPPVLPDLETGLVGQWIIVDGDLVIQNLNDILAKANLDLGIDKDLLNINVLGSNVIVSSNTVSNGATSLVIDTNAIHYILKLNLDGTFSLHTDEIAATGPGVAVNIEVHGTYELELLTGDNPEDIVQVFMAPTEVMVTAKAGNIQAADVVELDGVDVSVWTLVDLSKDGLILAADINVNTHFFGFNFTTGEIELVRN